MCHNPNATDAVVRPEDAMPPEAIDFPLMIHRIHSGAELSRDYVIYGYRGSVNSYADVHFPGNRADCTNCHVGDSQFPPLQANLLQVTDPRGFLNPVGPTAGACLGCHDNLQAASHTLANTSLLGESCGACHGEGKIFAVDKVHAQ